MTWEIVMKQKIAVKVDDLNSSVQLQTCTLGYRFRNPRRCSDGYCWTKRRR